jgi:CMP-2-keto-3-deoxyoctulosonic acid synthetase
VVKLKNLAKEQFSSNGFNLVVMAIFCFKVIKQALMFKQNKIKYKCTMWHIELIWLGLYAFFAHNLEKYLKFSKIAKFLLLKVKNYSKM